jgi:succinate-acetate transporter protein
VHGWPDHTARWWRYRTIRQAGIGSRWYDAVGLFSFAFPTFLVNVAVLSHRPTSSRSLGAAILLGGFGQVIAGRQEFKRRLFGAITFTLFGLFWGTYGFVAWMPELGWL